MKKLVSFLMVAFVMASLLAVCVSAEQTNMEVTVPKFTAQPTFDGVVSEEEWGAKTIRVVTDGAATPSSEAVSFNEELGLRNIYYYYEIEGVSETLAYDMWLRWDDQYMYVAIKVDDPDPYSNPNSGKDCWAGDCVQLRIDNKGPSAIMLNANPDFNYKTDAFLGARYSEPWSSKNDVIDVILALSKGKNPVMWRGESNTVKDFNMTTGDHKGQVGIAVVDDGDDTCTITYEAAISWSDVDALMTPKAGDVYGMAVAVAATDSNAENGEGYSGVLQWGQGAMFKDGDNAQPRATRGGSQAIILSDEAVTPADGYEIATEEVTETEATTEDNSPVVTKGDDDKADETTKENDKKPVGGTGVVDDDSNTGLIIGIVAAVLVVVAVVVVIIVKKKKN